MATKTDDVTKTDEEQAPAVDTEAEGAEAAGELSEEPGESGEAGASEPSEEFEELEPSEELQEKTPSGVGQGAGAVVSAALGLVSLNGGWIGSVASAREQLIGQLRTSSSAGVAQQLKAVYGNAWQTTALWAGLFALTALITGVVVLARPAFFAPGRPQAGWIRSVAWAGVSLGVVGLILAVLKYTDALLGLPSAG
ncbi:hypothetical protein ACWD5V_07215 [Streptomyces sp. NPDC002523]